MDGTSRLPSDEAEPLSTRPPLRASIEDIELRNQSYDVSGSPSPSLASTASYSRASEASAPGTPIDSHQQRHLQTHHQNYTPSYQNIKHQGDDRVQRLWLWEALSITIASLALAAIIITLVLHRDRPLPKWPSAITINALISVFTAVFKACLMMPIAESLGQLKWLWYQKSRSLRYMKQWDLASRGPWGSLLLILVLKSRDLAVIGAILTIVAMAVDPFTQQIVQVYSCSRVVEAERSTAPFSNNYTTRFSEEQTLNPDLDPQMQLAIFIGLLDPPTNVSSVLGFECRTGNCTFPSTDDGAAFLSLGMESRCADISSEISISVTTQNVTTRFNETAVYKTTHTSLVDYGISKGNFQMQSGFILSVDRPSSFLLKLSFLMTSNSYVLHHTQAFECEFYPVVNTYSANVTNGVLLEEILDSQRMDVWPLNTFNTHTLLLVNRTIRAGEWYECTSSKEISDEHNFPIVHYVDHQGLDLGTTYSLDQLINKSAWGVNDTNWWPHDCVYSIASETTEGLAGALSVFLGNESLKHDPSTGKSKGNLWSVNLYRDGSATLDTVQAAMDGLPRSITARLRQGDGHSNNVGPVIGTVWGNQTCVRVNWGWIALPAGLLLLTVVFLILTILKTRSKQARIWKSSILAVLFSGLDRETRQADGPLASMEEMKAAADKATVRLEDTKEGFRLVGQA